MKFGGSLLAGKEGVSRVARIVQRHTKGNQIVVVVSAIGDSTDILHEAAKSALVRDESGTKTRLDELRAVQAEAVGQLREERRPLVKKMVEGLMEDLASALKGVSLLKELTPRSRDLIVSFGERLSAPIASAAIQDAGINSRALTGAEAGIATDDSFGEAYPDFAQTRKGVRQSLSSLISKGVVPVVTGFIAATSSGETTTLGRGGSDYTATILADALGADEVWIWTDVDGIMTADPRVVHGARVVKELSYAEAEEMAFFGAKNMHPLALGPARLAEIPVRIRNGHRPDLPGTLIHKVERRRAGVAKAIMSVRKVGLLTISGETLLGRPGTAGRVFTALGEAGVNVFMISQSVSESNISMVVRRDSLQKAQEALRSEHLSRDQDMGVEAERDVTVIAAVGAGMKGTPGFAAKVFRAVAQAGVNVRMIAQGSSELNISFVVREKDATKAVEALHSHLLGAR
jgi:aspartate kinase